MFHVKHLTVFMNMRPYCLNGNEKINLVSKNTLVDIWERHFLDSGQIIKSRRGIGKKMGRCGLWSWFPWIGSCFIAKR